MEGEKKIISCCPESKGCCVQAPVACAAPVYIHHPEKKPEITGPVLKIETPKAPEQK